MASSDSRRMSRDRRLRGTGRRERPGHPVEHAVTDRPALPRRQVIGPTGAHGRDQEALLVEAHLAGMLALAGERGGAAARGGAGFLGFRRREGRLAADARGERRAGRDEQRDQGDSVSFHGAGDYKIESG
jgi:hypothetical protein